MYRSQIGNEADWPKEGGAAIMHGKSQIAVYNYTSKKMWCA